MERHHAGRWAERLEELARGGDAEELARRHGVRVRTLIWWRSQLGRRLPTQAGQEAEHLAAIIAASLRSC